MNSAHIALTYVKLRNKYYPDLQPINLIDVNHRDFIELAKLLDRERIDYLKYIDFVFGMLDYKYPITPKGLSNPVLFLRYHEMIR
jgi:hypothetical protein